MRTILDPLLASSFLAAALLCASAGEAAAQCAPQIVGTLGSGGPDETDAVVSGTTAYVTAGTSLYAVDVSNSASPSIAAPSSIPNGDVSSRDAAARGASVGLVERAIEAGAWGALPAAVRAAVLDQTYAPRALETGAWAAANAEQGYALAFRGEGVALTEADAGWTLGMKLTAWGRGDVLTQVADAEPTLSAGRIEYARGELVEWYQNLPRGLEQGFTLAASPAGEGDLLFRIGLDGLAPREEGANRIALTDPSGACAATYTGLLALDADGDVLPATLRARGGEIVIQVDDSGASYPVIVDPWVELKKLTASDAAAGAQYGKSVAVDGDTMVIGTPGDGGGTGSVYVLSRDAGGPGNWGEVKKIVHPEPVGGGAFGRSVALSGDTLIVGAVAGTASSSGTAYILERNLGGAENWGLAASLASTAPGTGNAFGQAVDIDVDTAVVSEPFEDTAIGNGGAAYVYGRDQGGPGTWGLVQKIYSGDPGINDVFGSDVAVSGDIVAVGSSFDDQFYVNGGAIFLFGRDVGGSDNWGQFKKVAGFYLSTGYLFGEAVSLDGDTLAGGAYASDQGGANFRGSVFVFDRNQGGADAWGLVTGIVGPFYGGGFFSQGSVEVSGTTLVVGSQIETAYVYDGGAGWSLVATLTASDAAASDLFGDAVAVSGGAAVIGAPQDDDGGGNSGSGYVFGMPATGDLALSVADCQDDADGSAGYQVEVELSMVVPPSGATGFAAFLDYDQTMFMYRGDLSSYMNTPFPLHISPIGQGDDGLLELDGSVNFGDGPASADALLATLVFDALVECDPGSPPIGFEVGGSFESKLSLDGEAVTTNLIDPDPFTLDDTPPVFDPYADITQAADASASDACLGAVVTFTDPTATDTCDPSPVVASVPPSGSLFAVGTTTVTTTATDACGNASMTTFDVFVTPTNVVSVDVELVGVNAAVSRCIQLVADDCSFANVTLSFVDHDGDDADEDGIDDTTAGGTNDPSTPVRAIDDIEVPCGEYTFLCAKDQQHTKWATSSLSLAGVKWTMDAVASLDGGDTDDDGDVDIDDVTLFLAQYGDPASSGGCPWDGTRDADFSTNGNVSTEDYGFLTANWLTSSDCLCTLPSTGPMRTRRAATTPLQRAADLSGDGWVDAEDVAIFERRNGLPDSLSRKMRGL